MRFVLIFFTILSIQLFAANENKQKCERVELGLLDEIISCPNGDYHAKYKYTNTIDIGSNTSQLSEKSKQLIKLIVLSPKSK
jgi:hypothetical protein